MKDIIILTFIFIILLSITNIFSITTDEPFAEERKFIELCRNESLIQEIPNNTFDNPKISIIIPVYNAEKLIISAIRSVQNQIFKDYEIVIVDDGSTDNSISLVEKESLIDHRIKIYKNGENKATFYTRLNGVKKSIGKYIYQLDADDLFCSDQALKILFETAEEKQMQIVHLRSIYNHGDLLLDYGPSIPQTVYDPIYGSNVKYFFHANGAGIIWDKFYKREVWEGVIEFFGEDAFNTRIAYYDDFLITYAIFKVAKSYYAINDILHFYYQNENSITHIKLNDRKLMDIYGVLSLTDKYTNLPGGEKFDLLIIMQQIFWKENFVLFVKQSKLETFEKYKELCITIDRSVEFGFDKSCNFFIPGNRTLINLAFTLNNDTYKNVKSSLESLIQVANNETSLYDIYFLIDTDITDDILDEFKIIFTRQTNFNLNLMFEEEIKEKIKLPFDSLYIPSFLRTLNKVIYIDSKILFLDDIKEIWYINIKDKFILGFPEKDKEVFESKYSLHTDQYINTSVLLINMDLINEYNIEHDIIYARLREIENEKDAWNIICTGKIGIFSSYNNLFNFTSVLSEK